MNKVAIYAFSTSAYFFSRLVKAVGDDFEWSIITPRGHHLDEMRDLVPVERFLYLYDKYNEVYEQEGEVKVVPQAGENFYLTLLRDKDGYQHLDKDEQLRRVSVVYRIYREFLLRVKPDFLLFPNIEVVDGFILLGLCAELGIKPIYHVGMRFLGGSFFSGDNYEALPNYFGEAAPDDLEKADRYLARIEAAGKIVPFAVNKMAAGHVPVAKPFVARVIGNILLSWGKERRYIGEDNFLLNVIVVFWRIYNPLCRWWYRVWQRKYFDVLTAADGLPDKYVFYALQHTPEASINGVTPYYVDQFRAIDRLLIALPHGYRLVVKEHPSMMGLRGSRFYQQLRRRPGVVMASPEVDSLRLIKGAALVASVTGTVGLECYILDKPCCLFGSSFFSHLCYDAEALMVRKNWIADIIENYRPAAREEKVRQLANILNIRYECELGDPFANPGLISADNVNKFGSALRRHIARLSQAVLG